MFSSYIVYFKDFIVFLVGVLDSVEIYAFMGDILNLSIGYVDLFNFNFIFIY